MTSINMGQSPSSKYYNEVGEGMPFFQGKAEFGDRHPVARKWCTQPTKVAEAGDILLSVRAPVGPTNIANTQCCIGRGLAAIQAIEPMYQPYLYYAFRFLEPWLSEQGTGTTFRAISGKFIKDISIPVAPLAEQKRIADKLDAVLARVDACREKLERVPAILTQFRQSVLQAATTGELTKDWREERGLEMDWEEVTVEELADTVFDGPFGSNLKTADYTDFGVRVVRLENIGWMSFFLEKETCISPEKYEDLKKHTLRSGDVLLSSFIADQIRVTLLPEVLSGKAINKADCFCVRTKPSACLPEYLVFELASPSTFKRMEASVHGATRPRINLGQLRSHTLRLPALEEQAEIVKRVKQAFQRASNVVEKFEQAVGSVNNLVPSLLSLAFRGELVPQDPADEPASVLLERLNGTAKPRPAKRTRKKTHNQPERFDPEDDGETLQVAEEEGRYGKKG